MYIEKVKIFSPHFEEQYDFYCNQLLLSCIEKNENYFCLKIGRSILEIQKTNEHPGSAYHLAFNIEPSLFLDAANYLRQKNIPLLENEGTVLIDFPDWNARSIYFKDADQNILEFIARYNLQPRQYKRLFNSDDILSISEVGVPVKEPVDFLLTLQSNTAIDVWKSYGEGFNAAGDEEGLLIIVKEKHKWFPTETLAEQLPAEIIIQQAGRHFEYGNLKFAFSPARQ